MKLYRVKKKKGFTVIEIIVVIGVMAMIAGMTLVSFPEFSERISVEQEAGKFSLALRRAQSYALAVREFGVGSGIFPGYGVNVSLASPDRYIVFGDPNRSTRYEDFLNETVETTAVERRARIIRICGNSQSVPAGSCALSSADLFYIRPGPTIVLTGVDAGLAAVYNDIKVTLSSFDGSIQRNVVIWSTGQVSIQ